MLLLSRKSPLTYSVLFGGIISKTPSQYSTGYGFGLEVVLGERSDVVVFNMEEDTTSLSANTSELHNINTIENNREKQINFLNFLIVCPPDQISDKV